MLKGNFIRSVMSNLRGHLTNTKNILKQISPKSLSKTEINNEYQNYFKCRK